MNARHLVLVLLLGGLAVAPIAGGALLADQASPQVVAAADAKAHLDETCTVEMTVRLTKYVPDKVCYLDSEKDFKDPKNVAVLIAAADLDAFEKAGVKDPDAFYEGKVIRVTGKLVFESEQVRIHVSDPKQIVVVDKKD